MKEVLFGKETVSITWSMVAILGTVSPICATLDYATATSPLGPYTYRGVIIDNWGSDRNLVNNHGCITEINGQWYIAYHRPTHATETGTMRKACLEPITFNPDGTIN